MGKQYGTSWQNALKYWYSRASLVWLTSYIILLPIHPSKNDFIVMFISESSFLVACGFVSIKKSFSVEKD